METYYLIDYENVKSKELVNCKEFVKTDHMHVFYTENARNIDLDIVNNHGSAEFMTHRVPTGKQVLDMHIVSYMGFLIGKNLEKSIRIYIISKDKDYDKLIDFWSEKAEIVRTEMIEPKSETERKNTKKVENKTQKNEKTSSKSDTKAKMNSEVQRILSDHEYGKEINHIAGIVSSHYGTKTFMRDVHNSLMQEYSDGGEIYQILKPLLSKYSK